MVYIDPEMILATGATGIPLFLAVFIIVILLNALMLWATAKLLKLTDNKFKTALITSLVAAVLNLVISFALGRMLAPIILGVLSAGLMLTLVNLVAAFIVNASLIKRFYKLETRKFFIISLIWTILSGIIGVIAFIIWIWLLLVGSFQ